MLKRQTIVAMALLFSLLPCTVLAQNASGTKTDAATKTEAVVARDAKKAAPLAQAVYKYNAAKAADKKRDPFGTGFWASSAVYFAGAAVDTASSRGGRELNPLYRNSDGTFSTGKSMAITGGIYAFTLIFQKKAPREMNWIRYILGGIRFGVGMRNYSVR